ncbi:hypothetical protein LJC15_04800 [Desulfovibrio sp. OttesenSCG-928-G11]|nr:hypothetical protein [Desulfovibrio sp. OttesenSCG-928-G11]
MLAEKVERTAPLHKRAAEDYTFALRHVQFFKFPAPGIIAYLSRTARFQRAAKKLRLFSFLAGQNTINMIYKE